MLTSSPTKSTSVFEHDTTALPEKREMLNWELPTLVWESVATAKDEDND